MQNVQVLSERDGDARERTAKQENEARKLRF